MSPSSKEWLAAMESQKTVAGAAEVLDTFLRQPSPDADTWIALTAAFRHLCTVAHTLDGEFIDQACQDLAVTFATGMTPVESGPL